MRRFKFTNAKKTIVHEYIKVSPYTVLQVELHLLHSDNCEIDWWSQKTFQELVAILRDPIQVQVQALFHQQTRTKNSGLEPQIRTGDGIRVAYTFKPQSVAQKCLVPHSRKKLHQNVLFHGFHIFQDKLVAYVYNLVTKLHNIQDEIVQYTNHQQKESDYFGSDVMENTQCKNARMKLKNMATRQNPKRKRKSQEKKEQQREATNNSKMNSAEEIGAVSKTSMQADEIKDKKGNKQHDKDGDGKKMGSDNSCSALCNEIYKNVLTGSGSSGSVSEEKFTAAFEQCKNKGTEGDNHKKDVAKANRNIGKKGFTFKRLGEKPSVSDSSNLKVTASSLDCKDKSAKNEDRESGHSSYGDRFDDANIENSNNESNSCRSNEDIVVQKENDINTNVVDDMNDDFSVSDEVLCNMDLSEKDIQQTQTLISNPDQKSPRVKHLESSPCKTISNEYSTSPGKVYRMKRKVSYTGSQKAKMQKTQTDSDTNSSQVNFSPGHSMKFEPKSEQNKQSIDDNGAIFIQTNDNGSAVSDNYKQVDKITKCNTVGNKPIDSKLDYNQNTKDGLTHGSQEMHYFESKSETKTRRQNLEIETQEIENESQMDQTPTNFGEKSKYSPKHAVEKPELFSSESFENSNEPHSGYESDGSIEFPARQKKVLQTKGSSSDSRSASPERHKIVLKTKRRNYSRSARMEALLHSLNDSDSKVDDDLSKDSSRSHDNFAQSDLKENERDSKDRGKEGKDKLSERFEPLETTDSEKNVHVNIHVERKLLRKAKISKMFEDFNTSESEENKQDEKKELQGKCGKEKESRLHRFEAELLDSDADECENYKIDDSEDTGNEKLQSGFKGFKKFSKRTKISTASKQPRNNTDDESEDEPQTGTRKITFKKSSAKPSPPKITKHSQLNLSQKSKTKESNKRAAKRKSGDRGKKYGSPSKAGNTIDKWLTCGTSTSQERSEIVSEEIGSRSRSSSGAKDGSRSFALDETGSKKQVQESIPDDVLIDEPVEIIQEDVEQLEEEIKHVRDVRALNDEQLHFLISKNEGYIKRVFRGKEICQRHQDYKAGGTKRRLLNRTAHLGMFTEDQHEMVMERLVHIFCRKTNKYLDYVLKVLLPETLIKIHMDLSDCTREETEKCIQDAMRRVSGVM